ncbi:Calcium-transporting ATPase 3 [Trichoderma lentiforme]|uniref:Calcium-transporting ATPase 3 n=1 Tax=Trichoderma lentiforme TaxID=1567552 RepID=A0A9P5CBV5_9HYPO|nr:Calcium-transporting ATPase 3 [Trichoderma lentiforme]
MEALHRRNNYVAMIGDSVNDSLSLIGIAMGSGPDVAKESSDIILTDDNFTSILNTTEEGRRIFDNIQKFALDVLTANIGFITSLLTGLAFKDNANVPVFLLNPVKIILAPVSLASQVLDLKLPSQTFSTAFPET